MTLPLRPVLLPALISLIAAPVLTSAPALADVPQVVTDIAPLQSMVAQVMDGVGTPELIIRPGVTPHDYALRPSDARRLQNADAVFWVGDELTPWFRDSLESLAADARRVEMLENKTTQILGFREEVVFAPGENPESDAQPADDHSAHSHDPHAWLDPVNGRAWLAVIAEELSALDPDNAASYRANAASGQALLSEVEAGITAQLSPLRDRPYVVFHDGYQYFENRFDIAAAGAISLGSGAAPSPARVAKIRAQVLAAGVVCVLSEPQFSDRLIATVFEGVDVKRAEVDAMGATLERGKTLYPALLRQMADSLTGCLR
jgi:zinc transport system substrate-binding protein